LKDGNSRAIWRLSWISHTEVLKEFSCSVGDPRQAFAHHGRCSPADLLRIAPQPVPHGRSVKLLFRIANVTDITADGRGNLFKFNSVIRGPLRTGLAASLLHLN
jgi:hypothetical protein